MAPYTPNLRSLDLLYTMDSELVCSCALAATIVFDPNKPSVYNKHLTHFANWGQELLSEADRGLVSQRFQSWALQYKALRIGSVKFSEGSWFLARPNMLPRGEESRMWFGHIRALVSHKSPGGAHTWLVEVRYRYGRTTGGRPSV